MSSLLGKKISQCKNKSNERESKISWEKEKEGGNNVNKGDINVFNLC